jgi:hypothetical protein
MSPSTARILTAVASAIVFFASIVVVTELVGDLRTTQHLRTDLAELEDVKYGLLNADVWVIQVSDILADRIDSFELNQTNRPQIKRKVELVLDRLLVEVEHYLRRRNASGDNLVQRIEGGLRQGLQDLLVDFNELRAQVPRYADVVLDELSRPENKVEMKQQLLAMIREAADATFTRLDMSAFQDVLARHQCGAPDACRARLGAEIAERQQQEVEQAFLVFGLIALLLVLNLPRRTLPPEAIFILTGATLVLLAGGVLTPMIEVEARIDELRFEILGSPVQFEDQVLYFQSKSIIDVVKLLADTGKPDMVLVAVLITLFSLIFPGLKVLATFVYYADAGGLRRRALTRFFALRSAKWSMADVLVVAIFMAYIGFSGLIASQLSGIADAGSGVRVMTTDGTSLLVGFYLFLGFVIASLLVSAKLESTVRPRTI